MPCRMIEWVWPPQTSIIAHGLGDRGVDVVEQPLRQVGVVELVEVLHCGALRSDACGCRGGLAGFLGRPRPRRRRTPPRAHPVRSKSSPASPGPTARRAAAGRTRRARSCTRRPAMSGTYSQADLLLARRRSRPGPSGCRPFVQISSTSPGTARHMALLLRPSITGVRSRRRELAEGEAAVVRRHQVVAQHREVRGRCRRSTHSRGEQRVEEHPAATGPPCRSRAGRAGRSATSTTRSATRAWKRAATTLGRRSAEHVVDDRARAPAPDRR